MLDIKLIRENPELVKEGIAHKGYTGALVDELLKVDEEYRSLVQEEEQLRSEKKKMDGAKADKKAAVTLRDRIKDIEKKKKEFSEKRVELLHQIPNLPADSSPEGLKEEDSVELKTWGDKKDFSFKPKDHLALAEKLGIVDFIRGAKVSGTQFYYLINEGALLENALIQFSLQKLVEKGFTPMITPDMARSKYYIGTGYMPKGDEAQTYEIDGEDLGLIATAEVTLAGFHSDETFASGELPKKYVGVSHCFRKEAGGYGRYAKGLYRVHQFSKVEMFIYCSPEESEKLHEELLAIEEDIYQSLMIPYRVLNIARGDLGAIAAKKYDIEAWMPGRNEYGEVTSTSNCTDYQARNLNIKYKQDEGGNDFVHMLNGTAIATSRTIVAILENFQNEDGSVDIPKALQPFMYGKKRIG